LRKHRELVAKLESGDGCNRVGGTRILPDKLSNGVGKEGYRRLGIFGNCNSSNLGTESKKEGGEKLIRIIPFERSEHSRKSVKTSPQKKKKQQERKQQKEDEDTI